jgi:dTDP-4-dehydrorhamnose reductase
MKPVNTAIIGCGFIGSHLRDYLGRQALVCTRTRAGNGIVAFDLERDCFTDIIENNTFGQSLTHAVVLAGIINPDTCARDPEKSNNVNVIGVKRLIGDLSANGASIIYCSTESVFGGEGRNYTEDDEPNPLMLYAHQKLDVEKYLTTHHRQNSLILRIGRVYGTTPGDGTLLDNWMKSFSTNGDIRCAADNYFSPVHIDDVVETIAWAIRSDAHGLYHVAGRERWNRLDLLNVLKDRIAARNIFDHYPNSKVITCRMSDFKTLEPRPLDTSLNTNRLQNDSGLIFPLMSERLDELLTKYDVKNVQRDYQV